MAQALREANADARLAQAEHALREEKQRSDRLRAVTDGQRAELRRVRLDYEARLKQQVDGAKDRVREAADAAASAAEQRTRAELEARLASAEEDAKAVRSRLAALTKELDESTAEARRKLSAETARLEGELRAARAESERMASMLQARLGAGSALGGGSNMHSGMLALPPPPMQDGGRPVSVEPPAVPGRQSARMPAGGAQ